MDSRESHNLNIKNVTRSHSSTDWMKWHASSQGSQANLDHLVRWSLGTDWKFWNPARIRTCKQVCIPPSSADRPLQISCTRCGGRGGRIGVETRLFLHSVCPIPWCSNSFLAKIMWWNDTDQQSPISFISSVERQPTYDSQLVARRASNHCIASTLGGKKRKTGLRLLNDRKTSRDGFALALVLTMIFISKFPNDAIKKVCSKIVSKFTRLPSTVTRCNWRSRNYEGMLYAHRAETLHLINFYACHEYIAKIQHRLSACLFPQGCRMSGSASTWTWASRYRNG